MDGTTGVNRFTGVTVTNGGSATAIGVRINNADRVLFAQHRHEHDRDDRREGAGCGEHEPADEPLERHHGDGLGHGRDPAEQHDRPAGARRRLRHRPLAADDVGRDGGPGHRELEHRHGRLGRHRHDLRDRRAGDGHPQLQRLAVLLRLRQLDEQRGRRRQPRHEPDGARSSSTRARSPARPGSRSTSTAAASAAAAWSTTARSTTGRASRSRSPAATAAGSRSPATSPTRPTPAAASSSAATATAPRASRGASKVLNTGASNAVALSANGNPASGHLVSFTNGGLDIDTTSGQGLTCEQRHG